jgi:hypothetical protein
MISWVGTAPSIVGSPSSGLSPLSGRSASIGWSSFAEGDERYLDRGRRGGGVVVTPVRSAPAPGRPEQPSGGHDEEEAAHGSFLLA